MTPQEFVTWFKGFAVAANPYNITPAQWDAIKEKLAQVHIDAPTLSYWHTTTTAGNPAEGRIEYTTNDDKRLLHD